MNSSKPNYSPKFPPPNTITRVGVRSSKYGFWVGNTNIRFMTEPNARPLKQCPRLKRQDDGQLSCVRSIQESFARLIPGSKFVF